MIQGDFVFPVRVESCIFINEPVFRSKLAMQGELHIGAKWYLTLANSDVPQVDSSHRKCCHYVISIRQKGVCTDFQASSPSVYRCFSPLQTPRNICVIFIPTLITFLTTFVTMKMNLIRPVHRFKLRQPPPLSLARLFRSSPSSMIRSFRKKEKDIRRVLYSSVMASENRCAYSARSSLQIKIRVHTGFRDQTKLNGTSRVQRTIFRGWRCR